VRSYDGREVDLPTWTAAQGEDWLGRWAMNLMLINVSSNMYDKAQGVPQDYAEAAKWYSKAADELSRNLGDDD
jgi:hypothetical protein